MGVSNFDKVGVGPFDQPNAIGATTNAQVINIARDATLVQTATIVLPRNAMIIGFDVFNDVAFDSATSATLSIGTAAAGTQFTGGLNAKTGGVVPATHTAAQSLLMKDIGAVNTTVFATVTSVGQPTVGATRVVVRYLVP